MKVYSTVFSFQSHAQKIIVVFRGIRIYGHCLVNLAVLALYSIALFEIHHHVTVELISLEQLIYKAKLFSHDTSIDGLVLPIITLVSFTLTKNDQQQTQGKFCTVRAVRKRKKNAFICPLPLPPFSHLPPKKNSWSQVTLYRQSQMLGLTWSTWKMFFAANSVTK